MELWDIYDKSRIKTGKTIERGKALPENGYHMVVHICIFNTQGEMLIQQRQPFKEGWSNLWDITVGGSAIAGETSSMAAKRELFEEIGYRYDFSKTRPSLTINFENGFDDYYLIEKDINIDSLKLQYEEVQRVKWASKDEILNMINTEIFIPYYESMIQLLFDMHKHLGAHRGE
ncbi:MAG TPA: NUDIX domain-containing protein [Caproicibacter sp.]|nr:NUDIX domain-containing protein [Caproicibacter sp.]